MSLQAENGNPNSQAAPSSASQNGASSLPRSGPVGRSALSQLLTQVDTTAADPNNENPLQTPPPGGTESTATATAEETGNQELPNGQAAEEVATGETGEVQPGEGELEPGVREHVTELARMLQAGELEIGEVKRISGLLKKRNGDQEELQTLRQTVEDLKLKVEGGATEAAPVTGGNGQNPFANVKGEAELRKMELAVLDVLDWTERNPDGGVYLGQEYTPEKVLEMKQDSRRAVNVWLPARGKELTAEATTNQSRGQVSQWVRTNVPWVHNREHADGQRAQVYLQDPAIRSRADGELIAAMLVLGERELRKQTTKAPPARPAAVTTATTPKGKPPGGGGSAAPRAGGGGGVQAAIAKVNETRSRGSLADLLKLTAAPTAAPPRK